MRAIGKTVAVVGAVLALALLLGASQATVLSQEAGPPVPPPSRRIADTDGNKVFDNLDAVLELAADDAPVGVIVLFNEALDQLDFPGLRGIIGDFDVTSRYHSIDAIATTLTKGQIIAASQLGVVRQIELDAIVRPHLDTATDWFGVQAARADFGDGGNDVDGNADGSGDYSADDIVIAVLDTGISAEHDDFGGGKILAQRDFVNDDLIANDEAACSYHGTHVSSIAAGVGGGDLAFTGVAPGAALVSLKVLGTQPAASGCVGFVSQVNAGIQWVIDNKVGFGIEVMNMSLGISGCADGTDSQSLLVNLVAAAGVVPVLSAGNEGPNSCTIGSPAAAADAITVAAMADPEHGAAVSFGGCGLAPAGGFYLVCFSSRGPTLDPDGTGVKPDIAAAGVLINAADGATDDGYKQLSGTSMSSPFTAGTVALMQHARLLAGQPLLTAAAAKQMIMDTAIDWGPLDGSADSGAEADLEYGAGRLDAYEAISAARGVSGTNIALPEHEFIEGTVAAANDPGDADVHTISVDDPTKGIGVTLITPDFAGGQPDIVMELLDPDGVAVSFDCGFSRQNTVGLDPADTVAGDYTVRVVSFQKGAAAGCPTTGPPFFGSGGRYWLDISAGSPTVAISITTDGTTPFGAQEFGITVDTTDTGTDDVQTVQVDTGPADLFIKSSVFSDGADTWLLGATIATDQVLWEFSTNGTLWTAFTAPDTLFTLAAGVATSDTQNVFFRLTIPTDSASVAEHSASVTIVAVAPP